MKYFTRERIVRLVTYNRITIFVARLFFMFSAIKKGENECLKFDKYRKFQVKSNVIDGKILFNENIGEIREVKVVSEYLEYSYVEGDRLKELIKNSPVGLKGLSNKIIFLV